MTWKEKISGCFGAADKIFGSHFLDEVRALQLLGILFENHVSLDEVKKAAEEFLTESGATPAHIKEQIKRIEKYYGPWLS